MRKLALVAALLGSAMLWNCVSQPENEAAPQADQDESQGSVVVPLTTVSNGRTFRLENAEFLFTGPRTQTFRSSSNREYLEVKLPVGSYTVRLQEGWQLVEVLSDGTEQAVMAELSGSDTQSLTVSSVTTGTARFQIQLVGGGTQLGLGRVGFDVSTETCIPVTCAEQGAQCGTIPDGCGNRISCGNCATGQHCNDSNQCVATCVPQECGNIECGMMADGCGGTVNCGDCDPGQVCDSRIYQCVSTCVPRTCSAANAECGSISDGCNGTLNCGSCDPGETCTANQCVSTCVPRTCAAANARCGSISDGCGGTLNCGSCDPGQTCNDSNQCVSTCVPRTCSAANAQCGSISDGCNGTLNCGSCDPGETCTANQCVSTCVPRTCAEAGAQCGALSDGCGETLQCGSCNPGQTCTANQCVSTPTSPIRVAFRENSRWPTGYCMDVILTNIGTRTTATWQAVIDVRGARVTSVWSANRTVTSAGLQLSSFDYNGRLSANASIGIGYCADNPTGGYLAPTIVTSSATF